MRKILLLLVLFCLFINISYAQITKDCDLSKEEIKNNIDFSLLKVLTEKDVDKSIKHLKKVCNNENEKAVNSKYLFSHLINIGFRKLDADSTTESIGIEPHKKGVKWRKYINKKVLSVDSDLSPKDIKKKFKKYWDVKNAYNLNSDGLAREYMNVCKDAITIKKSRLQLRNPMAENNIVTNIRSKCNKMAEARINREINYVNQLMIKRGNYIMKNMIRSYANNYFMGKKGVNLIEDFSRMKGNFESVYQQVTEGTKVCKT